MNYIPMTPVQSWAFEQFPRPEVVVLSRLWEPTKRLDPELLIKTMKLVIGHHDALRLRFIQDKGQWKQFLVDTDELTSFRLINISHLPKGEQSSMIENSVKEYEKGMDLSHEVIRLVLFDLGLSEPQRLLLIISHFCIDGYSLRFVCADFMNTYQQLESRERVLLPPKTATFVEWTERLKLYAQSEEIKARVDYWKSLLWNKVEIPPLNPKQGGEETVNALSVVETQALLDRIKLNNFVNINQLSNLLLATLLACSSKLTKNYVWSAHTLHNGRTTIFDNINLFRTCGYIVAYVPHVIDLHGVSTHNILKTVIDYNNSIPNGGIDYGVLRYLTVNKQLTNFFSDNPHPLIGFNYRGIKNRVALGKLPLFQIARESVGYLKDHLDFNERHMITMDASVANGQLNIRIWTHVDSPVKSYELFSHFIDSLNIII